jgi:tight adherence protein B
VKAFELLLFVSGASLLSLFLLGTVAPGARNRLRRTADAASTDLREDVLFLPPRRIFLFLAASGALFALAAAVLGEVAWAAVAAPLPALLSGAAVRAYRRRRRRTVVSQLPGLLDILAGHVSAGHSLREAVSGALPLLSGGMRKEMEWLSRLCRLGTPLPKALLQWERRMPCEEIFLVTRPLRIALPAGGNVVDLLSRTRDALRSRIRMEEKMRSMTAQARLQAAVLTLLPPGFVAALSLVDPAFIGRCTGTPLGKAILCVAAVLQATGWIFIRKILAARP